LSPSSVESSKASLHVAEDILVLEALEGVFFSGAGLVIILAFALIGEDFISAA
jgi:hypothetical protein